MMPGILRILKQLDKLTHENFIAWSHYGNKGFTKEEWMSWISPDFPKAAKIKNNI